MITRNLSLKNYFNRGSPSTKVQLTDEEKDFLGIPIGK